MKSLVCLLLLVLTLPGYSGEKSPAPVIDDTCPGKCFGPMDLIQQDFEYSKQILNWQEDVTEKPLKILEYNQSQPFKPGVILSGAYWGNYLRESTNTIAAPFGGLFPILSRFPGERGNFTTSSSRWLTSNAAFAATVRPTDWLTFYSQYEFTEVDFPGQEDWTWRKYYGMIGNLDRFPVYAYYGRNTGDFGWMDGYNSFTHTVNNHFFRVESDQPIIGLGYKKDGLHIVGNLIHSGRQIRVADTADSDGYSNGSVNISQQFGSEDNYIKVGAGYLHDTIYNSVIAHHPDTPTEVASRATTLIHNPAYDLYLEVKRGRLSLGVERTETFQDWPATNHDVAATTFQAAYDFDLFDRPTRLSAVYGVGRQGPDRTQYKRLTQFVFGIETEINPMFRLSMEYVHNEAFVPLIRIAQPGVSNAGVEADAILLGGKISF